MEQRPLRLGDIVDDYCPRERRLTNHVIVAVVEDAIRQTRCTTCDAEHVYKDGREPRRKRKDSPAELPVAPAEPVVAAAAAVTAAAAPAQLVQPRVAAPPDAVARREEPPAPSAAPEAHTNGASHVRDEDAWPGHRQLIRATLPRTDAEPTPRPIPEFTMHQRGGHGYRHSGSWNQYANGNGNGNGNGNANGNVAGRHNGRPGRHGHGHGPGQPGNGHGGGQGAGKPGRHRGGRNRRSR